MWSSDDMNQSWLFPKSIHWYSFIFVLCLVIYCEKIRVFKADVCLNTLAWNNHIWLSCWFDWFEYGSKIKRDSWGYSYSIVRGEILGFMEDEQVRKHLQRMFSSRTKVRGSKRIRYPRSLNYKRYRLGVSNGHCVFTSTLWEIKVFGFRGEYGRKAET